MKQTTIEVIGLIPAAGKGSRLGLPYPKELYPIIQKNHYKPVSEFILDHFKRAGIQHTVFVINETKHQLIAYFGSGQRFGCYISYIYQELAKGNNFVSTSPGLAHALSSAYHLIKDKNVVFGMADTIILPENGIQKLYENFLNNDSDITLGLFLTDCPQKFGMVVSSEGYDVSEIIDKPTTSDLKFMWGCIAWNPRFTEFLRDQVENGESDLASILNHAISSGLIIRGFVVPSGRYYDLGTYEEIMQIDQLIKLQK
jgi:glucose-1-phosphate thymidylyltransferase